MSRREDRASESKRRHSRLHREPSPKRSRRDAKPEAERLNVEHELDKDGVERDHKSRRGLQDPLPLEAPLFHDSKVEVETTRRESENRTAHQGSSKHSSDPSRVPESRAYFKHDDRGSRRNGGSFSRCTDSERGWWRDHKEQQNDRGINKTVSSDAQQMDQKTKDNREAIHVRNHDGYFETAANPKLPERKRPSFREQKLPVDPEKTNKAAADLMSPHPQNIAVDDGSRDERRHTHRHPGKQERPFAGYRALNKSQGWRLGNSSRGRSSASSRYRRRDKFMGRQGRHPTRGRVEKWKHDLYDEANKSPTPENEEDRIKKIEALLAS